MINNQFSRRDLTTETRLALAYQFKEFEAEKAKARMEATQFKEVDITASAPVCSPENSNTTAETQECSKGKTLEVIAKKAGVSTRTAEQYDAIQRKGTEEQKAEVFSGNFSIKKVYSQIIKFGRDSHNFHQSVFFQEFHKMR
jgi:hypothetical protein